MRAVIVEHPGGPDVLKIGEVPDPVPERGELLVRVHATALNRLDLLQREGRYPLPPGAPETLGVEMAGEVVGWGEDVTGWTRGDRVCALLLGGGYAEQVTVPTAMAIRPMRTLDWLMRSRSSRGGRRQTTSVTLRVRRRRFSRRNIRLRTKDRAKAA